MRKQTQKKKIKLLKNTASIQNLTFSLFGAIICTAKESWGDFMKGYVLDYIDENEFKKLERALKKYNMLAFKKINFEYYPALRNGKFLGELVSQNKKAATATYELKLPSDKMFSQVHGDVKLIYTVYEKEKVVMLNTITPSDILLEGHKSELTTYKGIMISKANASKDMFKIDLLNMLQNK